MKRILTAIIVCLAIATGSRTAFAQFNGKAYSELEVILYDAETIERINKPKTPPLPITPSPVAPSVTAPSVLNIQPPPPPIYPRDLSPRYTMIEKGVPIIIDPQPCEPSKPDLAITIENVENSKGFIVADLHDDNEENFLNSDKVVIRIRATAQAGRTYFCLPLPSPGEYAVGIYHDENDNYKFDKGFLKIPKERFGMSNNPPFGLKAPDYSESAFTVPETGTEITIQLFSSGDILKGSKR